MSVDLTDDERKMLFRAFRGESLFGFPSQTETQLTAIAIAGLSRKRLLNGDAGLTDYGHEIALELFKLDLSQRPTSKQEPKPFDEVVRAIKELMWCAEMSGPCQEFPRFAVYVENARAALSRYDASIGEHANAHQS